MNTRLKFNRNQPSVIAIAGNFDSLSAPGTFIRYRADSPRPALDPMALRPDYYREIITFENLLLGEAFEFSPRINFSEFRRKQTARKVS